MRFEENRDAGRGVREFRNLDPPPDGPKPGHLDLGWSSVVRQVGTRRTGRMEHVDVFYHRGKRRRRFTGHLANKILKLAYKKGAQHGTETMRRSETPPGRTSGNCPSAHSGG